MYELRGQWTEERWGWGDTLLPVDDPDYTRAVGVEHELPEIAVAEIHRLWPRHVCVSIDEITELKEGEVVENRVVMRDHDSAGVEVAQLEILFVVDILAERVVWPMLVVYRFAARAA